jgi:glycine oxidase
MNAATRVIPSLPNWTLVEFWGGLRPRRDDAPVLGSTRIPNLCVAGGQFRNGILFAPAVAEYIARTICGQSRGPLAAAFDPPRFALH